MQQVLRKLARNAWENPLDILDREFDRALVRWADNGDPPGAYPVDIPIK